MRGAGIPKLWSVKVIIRFCFPSNQDKIRSTAHFVYNNIATSHLCLQSVCLPCSTKMLRYLESQNRWLASGLLYRIKQNINYPGGGDGTPFKVLYDEAPYERGSFFSLQVNERVGVLLVEVFKRVGNLSFGSVKWPNGLNRWTPSQARGNVLFLDLFLFKFGCNVLNEVCKRGTIFQQKLYERGTFSVKNGI